MMQKNFKQLLEQAKQGDSYWAGKAIQDFTEDLFLLMQQQGVSKAELARRIDSSPAYVTKVLRGNSNFTIESMVRLVRALDGKLCLHVCPEDRETRWFDVIHGTHKPEIESGDYVPVEHSELSFGSGDWMDSDESTLAA